MTKETPHRSGLLGPFILIAVGVIFLFQNLGLFGTNLWDTILKYWPIILILLGINDMVRTKGIFGPTMSVGLGAILLANSLGILRWDSWIAILRLWPILVIAIGLEIFIGRKNIFLSMTGVAMALALLAGGLWMAGGVLGAESIIPVGDVVVSEEISQPLDDAKYAEMTIEASVGELSIGALSGDETLIEGMIYSVPQETIRENYEKDGKTITYYLNSDWDPSFSGSDSNKRLSWDLDFTKEIPLNLDISLGVGESNIDLSEMQIDDITLDIGVGQAQIEFPEGSYQAYVQGGIGQTIITLPKEGEIEIDVNGGIGEIIIYVPEDVNAKIYVDRGIAGLNMPSGYRQQEDTYYSPNFDENEAYIEITIEQGIGNIALREK